MLSRLSRWFHRLPNVAGPARIGRRHRQQLRLVNLEQRVTPMAGQLDPTFGVGGLVTTTVPEYYFDQGYSPAVDSQGRVLVAGSTQSGSKYLFAVARITTTGILDTSFGIEGKVTFGFDVSESYGYSVAVDSTDRVLVSGEVYNGSKYDFAVARLTNTGTLDPSFDGDGKATISFGVSSRGFRVAVDSTDRVLVSGMTYDGSNFDFAVARLTINGALDSTFDGDGKQTIDFGGTDDRGFSVAVDSADRVVIGGRTVFGSSSRFAVVRLTDTGALDPSFDTDGKASFAFGNVIAYDANVAIDSADRILVSGFTSANANYDFGVARLTVTGSLDTTFDGDGKVTIAFGLAADVGVGVAVDSLDRVVVSGYTFNGSNNDFAVARLTSAGTLDVSFDGDGKTTFAFGATDDFGLGVTIDALGRILVAGYTGATEVVFAVARLTAAGLLDASFDDDGKQTAEFGMSSTAFGRATTLDTQGRVLVCGYAGSGNNTNFSVMRYDSLGHLDKSFGGTGIVQIDFGSAAYGNAIAVDSVDRVIIAGYTYDNSNYDFAVTRLGADGMLDMSFDSDGKTSIPFGIDNGIATSVAVDLLDRVVVAGYTGNGSTSSFVAARLSVTGALDPSFDLDGKQTVAFGGPYDRATAVAIDSLERIVIGGYGGPSSSFAVARLTNDGALDVSFDLDGRQTIGFSGSYDFAYSVAFDSSDRVIIGGYTGSAFVGEFAVARLTNAGALDVSFDADGKQTIRFGAIKDTCYGVAVDASNRILLAGDTLDKLNGSNNDFAVCRLTIAGALDTTFDGDGKKTIDFGGSQDIAYGVTRDSAGRAIVAGTATGTESVFALARLTGDAPCVIAVVINNGAAQRSRVTQLRVDFSSVVDFTGIPATAFRLRRQSDNALVGLTASVSTGAITHVTLTFAGAVSDFGSLQDGRYTLSIVADRVSAGGQLLDGDCNGTGGDDYVLVGNSTNKLFRLFGDWDGDGNVATNDFIQFRLAVQSNPPFDFDNDGAVAASDFIQFRLRFGGSI